MHMLGLVDEEFVSPQLLAKRLNCLDRDRIDWLLGAQPGEVRCVDTLAVRIMWHTTARLSSKAQECTYSTVSVVGRILWDAGLVFDMLCAGYLSCVVMLPVL
jgi:hypothetical protein